jgi:hypothetical protein
MSELQRAARDVFHGYFGPWWPLAVAAVAGIILAPSVIFWEHISIDIPKFVEEWTKLGIGTVVLFFLLEIVNRRRDLNSSDERNRFLVTNHILGPLLGLQDDLRLHLARLASSPSEHDPARTTRMRNIWQHLVREISLMPLSKLDREWPPGLLTHNYMRDERLLEALLRADSDSALDPDEQRELNESLAYLEAEIRRYVSSEPGTRS